MIIGNFAEAAKHIEAHCETHCESIKMGKMGSSSFPSVAEDNNTHSDVTVLGSEEDSELVDMVKRPR
jgi:hypothetical protein